MTQVSVASDLATASTADLGTTTVSVDLLPAPVATVLPAVSGTPRVGQVLTATGGTWDLEGVELGHQWLRDGTPIAGATATTYVLAPGDLGAVVTVRVTATLADHAPGTATPRTGQRPVLMMKVTAAGITPTGAVSVRCAGKDVRNLPIRLVRGVARVSLPSKKPRTYYLKVTFAPTAAFAASGITRTVTVRT